MSHPLNPQICINALFRKNLQSRSAPRCGYHVTRRFRLLTNCSKVIKAVTACVAFLSAATVAHATTFTIGGTVSGLGKGDSVTLLDNGKTPLQIKANGAFTFAAALAGGTKYDVTVSVEPIGETCTVTKGTGTVVAADVKTVAVTCKVKTYMIGGTVSGLGKGDFVTLLDNGKGALRVIKNGPFAFATGLVGGAKYDVTVSVESIGETCTVTKGTGKVVAANVKTVTVACKPKTYTIGGTLAGLVASKSVTLLDNGKGALTLSKNGAFTFPTALLSGAAYDVSVSKQPAGETCTVTKGTGKVGTADVKTVSVACKPTTTLTYSIGGSVTGLSGGASVTLLDNTTDSVTVTSNTTFTFKTKLASGASYSVTVGTQPKGESCTVSGGSGKVASANVTTVVVTCKTSSGGGGGSGAFWIPYLAKPVSGGTGGSTGLFVIPSDEISSSPTPTWITTSAANVLALGVDITISNGGLTNYVPELLAYSAADSGGNTHVYGLTLGGTATVPKPVQIGNLSLSSSQTICDFSSGQVNLTDPTTIFMVLGTGTAPDCESGETFEVVHYTDSAAKAPVPVSLHESSFDELYNNGTLSGILVYDYTTGNVNLYADDTFTSPKVLFTGATDAESFGNGSSKIATETSNLFYSVTVAPTTGNPSGQTLYRIDASGTPTQIFQGVIGGHVTDDNNLYFVNLASSTSTVIYQESASGGTPTKLFSGPATMKNGTTTENLDYEPLGSNDSVLIYSVSEGSILAGTTTLYNVPVGTLSASATNIATYTGGVSAFLGTPSGDSASDDVLFVTNTIVTETNTGLSYSYSSVAFPPGGPYTAKPTANSTYETLGLLSSQLEGSAWRVKGITDTDGGFGGGTVYQTDIGTLADTQMTTTGGGAYTFPTGYIGILDGLSTSGVAVGDFLDLYTTANPKPGDIGVAVDLTKNFLYPIKISSTNVDF
jgi:hypothetical protein